MKNLAFECLRGAQGASVLKSTGLLEEAAEEVSMPFLPSEIFEVVAGPSGYAVLGYYDDEPVGYIAGQVHYAGNYEQHLFVHQAWTKGQPAWSREAFAYLEKVGKLLGCQAISTTTTMDIAKSVQRRYGFKPVGIYMVKRLNGVTQ